MTNTIHTLLCSKLGHCDLVSAKDAGLDPRAGDIYVGFDFVATTNSHNLAYYGGFEYHDGAKEETPSYDVYFVAPGAEDDRVARAMHYIQHGTHADELDD